MRHGGYRTDRPTKFFKQEYNKQRRGSLANNHNYSSQYLYDTRQEEEEPICALKIEFDGE